MAADIFLLAVYAALYPTLLAAVVILLAQSHPRRLLTVYLLGGMTVSIVAGLVIVFALSDSDWLEHGEHSSLSWTADLTFGGLALLAAVALSLRAESACASAGAAAAQGWRRSGAASRGRSGSWPAVRRRSCSSPPWSSPCPAPPT